MAFSNDAEGKQSSGIKALLGLAVLVHSSEVDKRFLANSSPTGEILGQTVLCLEDSNPYVQTIKSL